MGQTIVTPEQMNVMATSIEGKIQEWQSAVQKIYQLHAEMDGMWDGTANDSFNLIFKEDEIKFNNLSNIMREYSNAIKTAANNYIAAEEEVKSIVTRRS
ncbi:MAG: WXG100 family type VII secretion target [Lachnospiraceae bacterium]